MSVNFESDFETRLEEYLERESLFSLAMLVLRAFSGDDVGQSVAGVSIRSEKYGRALERRRQEAGEGAETLTLLDTVLSQLADVEAQIAEIDLELDVLRAELAALNAEAERFEEWYGELQRSAYIWGNEEGIRELLEEEPEFAAELRRHLERGGFDLSDLEEGRLRFALATAGFGPNMDRAHRNDRRDLVGRIHELEQQREDLEAEAAMLRERASELGYDAASDEVDASILDKAATTTRDAEDAAELLEGAGRTEADIDAGLEDQAFQRAFSDVEENDLRADAEISELTDTLEGMELDGLSAASKIGETPIGAEPITAHFNASASETTVPEADARAEIEEPQVTTTALP